MAKDIYRVLVHIEGPSWEYENTDQWDEHYHNNGDGCDALNVVLLGALDNEALLDLGYAVRAETLRVDVDDISFTAAERRLHKRQRTDEQIAEDKRDDELDKLANKLKIERCIWSVSDIHDDLLANNLLMAGRVRFVYPSFTGNWGKGADVEVDNPTYQDAWKAADELIKRSGDYHHSFLEFLQVRPGEGEVKVIECCFGS